jgi:hypothetical protein
MTILRTETTPPRQARTAFGVASSTAAIGLVTASAGFGAVYAWKTGSAHGFLLGGLTVIFALALEVAKPLAVQGFFSAARAWAFGQALCLAVLAVLAVAYSLTAELSLMASIRSDVVASRQAQSRAAKDHAKAAEHREVERQRIERELTTVGKARPAAELKALIASYRSKGVCAIPDMALVCPATKLAPEHGRAERREKLELALAALNQGEQSVSAAPIEVKADPAAEALATYLGLFGITVLPATLTEIMILVPVLALEIGSALAVVLMRAAAMGGASLPLGMELAWGTRGTEGSLPATLPATPAINALPAVAGNVRSIEVGAQAGRLPSTAANGARERLLVMLQGGQGVVRGCQAEIGRAVGVSRARVRQLLGDLAAAGMIRVRTSPTGTVISLVAPSERVVRVH